MSRRAAWPLLLVLLAGCGGTKTVTSTVTVDETARHAPGAPIVQVLFGHIASLVRRGATYELKFDHDPNAPGLKKSDTILTTALVAKF